MRLEIMIRPGIHARKAKVLCQPERKILQWWCRTPLQYPGTICWRIWSWQRYCASPYQVKEWTQVLSWAKGKFQNGSLWRDKIFKVRSYSTNCTLWWKQEFHTWVLLRIGRKIIFPVRGSRSCLHVDRSSENQFISKWTKGAYSYQIFHHSKNLMEQSTDELTEFLYLL